MRLLKRIKGKGMKIQIDKVAQAFPELTADDLRLLEQMVPMLDIGITITNPVLFFYCVLQLAGALDEIRSVEVKGKRIAPVEYDRLRGFIGA